MIKNFFIKRNLKKKYKFYFIKKINYVIKNNIYK